MPLAPRALAALVAVGVVGRAERPAELLAAWSSLIRPGGRVLIAESERAFPPWLRSRLDAEDLTAMLLNAGYSEIGQATRGTDVLTWGAAAGPSGLT
jgi:2-polyprenyl-3-methyl-5-hydroxy-6-metoxy-1,4-benzoquinol methylase